MCITNKVNTKKVRDIVKFLKDKPGRTYNLKENSRWYQAFTKASVCIGNHDRVIDRKAKVTGVSTKWMSEVLGNYWMELCRRNRNT